MPRLPLWILQKLSLIPLSAHTARKISADNMVPIIPVLPIVVLFVQPDSEDEEGKA